MAKHRRKPQGATITDDIPASARIARNGETRLEGFAEDLGRLIGTAQAKAESWLGQRKRIVENLTQLRDTANNLLTQLGSSVQQARRGRRPGRPAATDNAKTKSAVPRKRRTMSARARKAISEAQKKRWAKVRAVAKLR